MSTRIAVIDRIVIAIAIEVQAVDGFGVQVGGIVGRDESAPFGAVITGVAVIQTGISDRILAKTPFGSLGDSKMLSPQRSNYIGKILCLFRNVSCRVPIPRWVFFVHIR
jgi:hypothetical protein